MNGAWTPFENTFKYIGLQEEYLILTGVTFSFTPPPFL